MTGAPDFVRLGDLLGKARGLGGPDTRPSADQSPGARQQARAAHRDQTAGGSGAVGTVLPGAGVTDTDLARLLAIVWPDVVGPEVAANARPVQLRNGRLVVSASSSAWAQTLQMMSEAIAARLQERLGPGSVQTMVFRHAGWEERSCPVGAASPEPAADVEKSSPYPASPATSPVERKMSKEEEEAVAAVERLDLAPELRDRILRTLAAAFVRAQHDSVR